MVLIIMLDDQNDFLRFIRVYVTIVDKLQLACYNKDDIRFTCFFI